MSNSGIIPGRLKERVTLRIRSLEPYSSELTALQIGVIADIAEKYGSGAVHVTPRQTIEMPDIELAYVEDVNGLLNNAGLYTGSSDKHLRNVIVCSRWCLYNSMPLGDIALKLNRRYQDRNFPGKTNISLSGCDFSCMRSRTSDVGVIARTEIELTDKECKKCSLCVKEPLGCQVDAIRIKDEGVFIDTERCIRCGFCTNVCKTETIRVKFRSFDIFIGGSGGIKPREALLFKNVASQEELISEINSILDKYSQVADDGERLGDVIERLGLKALEA